jgi:uncharacterized protein YprB with RNaseH-like and TPR domain
MDDAQKRADCVAGGWEQGGKPSAGPNDSRWSVERVVPGVIRTSSAGSFFHSQRRFDLGYRYGRIPLSTLTEAGLQRLGGLCRGPSPESLELSRTVFLDTETTGLAGGSGTYAFLVGIGYFNDGKFVVEQYFMRDFPEERALLVGLRETLSRFDGVVSYNGKCFDLPLLDTRYIYSRLSNPLSEPVHLDLLFPSRRLWRRRLSDCRLGTVEREILGADRPDDIPSAEIPLLYFTYLRSRDARLLPRVFAHNQRDILSLAALAGHISHLLHHPGRSPGNDPLDLYSLGRVLSQIRRLDESVACFYSALSEPIGPRERKEVQTLLARTLRRLNRWPEAASIWARMVEDGGGADILASEELAKYLEHAVRDFPGATRVVERALERMRIRNELSGESAFQERCAALQHRLARLKRKMHR